MLIRLSLIIAIIAGLAAGVLNFVMVKDKVTTLTNDRNDQRKQKEDALTKLAATKRDLDTTTAKLKQTEATLTATTEERDKAQQDLAAMTKRADKLAADLQKTTKDLDDAQVRLEAFRRTELTPEQIMAFKKEFKGLQANLEGVQAENIVLGRKVYALQTELDRYKQPDNPPPVLLPAGLIGKVLVADPKWNFVVVNVGQDQGVLEYGELLVNRNGNLVAKVIVRTVQKNYCIANLMPGWGVGEILEGDQVIPAHPTSS